MGLGASRPAHVPGVTNFNNPSVGKLGSLAGDLRNHRRTDAAPFRTGPGGDLLITLTSETCRPVLDISKQRHLSLGYIKDHGSSEATKVIYQVTTACLAS